MRKIMKELEQFIEQWQETKTETRKAFIEIMEYLNSMEGVTLKFNARPGVSYSMRAHHANQKERPLFVMADVIDDDPAERWLSVCFYGDMITDPDEMGDLIPEGLLGSDGYCFDIDEYDAVTIAYVKKRLDEAGLI